MKQDVISIKTRNAFREYMVGWVLREISDEFDSAHIVSDFSYLPPVSGQRRTLIEQYYRTIDWTNPTHVRRIIQVFETVLYRAEQNAQQVDTWQETRKKEFENLRWCLQRDGFKWIDARLHSEGSFELLSNIKNTAEAFDARHMADQIRRMESSIDSDPSLAIGTAKELIETCCKTILAERGKSISGTPDVSSLTKETLKELKLVPEGISDAARGADTIKRLLSNLGAIGNGLAELRGLYGTGHGRHGQSIGVQPRHAKLAVGAAVTLATFLFETHSDNKD